MSETEELYRIFNDHPEISTDTRNIVPDSIFFALKGENFDANEFAFEALEKGAAFAVVDDQNLENKAGIVKVKDALQSLQNLAHHHRKAIALPVIGITGSNGKTTTKELLHAVLSRKYKVLATVGNFNNHIGVPLTLLRLNKEHDMAIVEMGANHLGEIEFLSSISDPDFGLITNIGKAHLKGFGSYEGVRKAKTELYRHIEKKEGVVFVNGKDKVLLEESVHMNRILYGEGGEYKISSQTHSDGRIELNVELESGERQRILTQLFGSYNFDNLCCAYTLGRYFEVNRDQIQGALSQYAPTNNRSQLLKLGSNTLILDAYNANPSSMELALSSFEELEAKNKMVVLGDMLELGDESVAEHLKIIDNVNEMGVEAIFVGPIFQSLRQEVKTFQSAEDAVKYLQDCNLEDYHLLIKGSRGIQLEKISEAFS